MGISLRNSLSGSVDPLVVPATRALTWYSCGPTVYDAAHLGHARNYICLDILHRVLTDHYGVAVATAVNVTDIDDKIIARAAEQGIDAGQLSRYWEAQFKHDMLRLGVRPPAAWLRVTDHMDLIIDFIQDLVESGYAYSTERGVYFSCAKLPSYGQLRQLAPDSDDNGIEGKSSRRDFALWKRSTTEPHWDSPWGQGRPGWHIECSTIAHSVFGCALAH
eukprot:COSAG05_NODE_2498_length_2979_cov_29.040286_3_plen_219_part_00